MSVSGKFFARMVAEGAKDLDAEMVECDKRQQSGDAWATHHLSVALADVASTIEIRLAALRETAMHREVNPDEAEARARQLGITNASNLVDCIEHVERHIRDHGALP
jgi:hypothetical protein